MALDAHIACSCFLKGKTKPFPAPGFEKHFVYKEGFWNFNAPLTPEYEDVHRLVWAWQETACEHREMSYYYRKLMSWGRLGRFEWMMEQLGAEKFPVFLSEIEAMANQKQTSNDVIPLMLDELTLFEQQESLGFAYFLIRADRSASLMDTIGGSFYTTSVLAAITAFDYGLDENSFFIAERNGQRLFQSQRFKINLITPTDDPRKHVVEYIALDSDQRYIGRLFYPFFLPTYEENINPALWSHVLYHVEQGPIPLDTFDNTVANFHEVLNAALKAEMPIAWSD